MGNVTDKRFIKSQFISRLYSLEYELKFEPAYIVYEKVSKFILSSALSIYEAKVSVIMEHYLLILIMVSNKTLREQHNVHFNSYT